MRGALFTGPFEKLSVEELTPLPLAAEDVFVRTTASGLCHSDLLPITDELPRREPLPTVLGHEGTGVVEEVGAGVVGLAPGDRVVCSWVSPCMRCFFCVRGETELCAGPPVPMLPKFKRADGSDVHSVLGTFSEAMIINQRSLVKVETELPDEQLALLGCGVTTGVCAVLNTAAVEPGSSVAVLGCGGVGQSVIQGAGIAGAERVIAIDPTEFKRETALAMGATEAIDPTATDAAEAVRELTGGRGADYAFEAAGRGDTADQGFDLIRRGGTLVLVGAPPKDVEPGWSSFAQVTGEKKVLGSLYGSAQIRRDFPRLVAMIEAGMLDVGAMVTQRIRLEDVNEGLDAIESGNVIRSVIVPGA